MGTKRLRWIALAISLGFAGAVWAADPKPAAPKRFDTAEAAAGALAEAVRSQDPNRILEIVGQPARNWLVTNDAAADRAERGVFLAAYDRKNAVVAKGEGKAALAVGDDNWEFPAPIVRKDGKWVFDAAAGREEILNRRIGRNELDTIQTLLAIVDAQREYAATDPDGDGYRDYASRFASTPGRKDGLYWESASGQPDSPLGPLVGKAVEEGYGEQVKAGKIQPYHGYVFRMLGSQGPDASGGAYNYRVGPRLFGGFAVIAHPDAYGITGVKSFIVNHDGVVYEKDLGPATVAEARKLKRFNPDKSWSKVPAE